MSDITRFTDTPERYFHSALELIDNSVPRSEEEQTMLVYQAGELIAKGILPQIAVVEDNDYLFRTPDSRKFEGYQTRVNPDAYKCKGLSIESAVTLYTKHVRDDGCPLDPEILSVELNAYKGILRGPEVVRPLVIQDGYVLSGGWIEAGSMLSGRGGELPHFHAALRCELEAGRPQSSSWDFCDREEDALGVPDLSVVRQLAYHLSKSSVVPPTTSPAPDAPVPPAA